MTQPLELVERQLIVQSLHLIERALCEVRSGEGCVRLVRRIVEVSSQVEGAIELIVVSEAWQQFSLLYPDSARDILSQARN